MNLCWLRAGIVSCLFGVVAAIAAAAETLPPDVRQLKIGDAAPDFRLPGIDGRDYTLADFASAEVLMVVFLSNHCPFSHAAETRLIPLAKEFASKGLAVVAINPNSPEGLRLDELGWSQYDDSFEDMKLYARDQGFPFPYLYDGDRQVAAKAYGCLATPHVFLFDRARKLQYVGRVDDSRFREPETVKTHDTRNAVMQLLAGQPVSMPTTPVMGCSTKWNEKRGEVQEALDRWNKEPVTLERIDAKGVRELAVNNSKRFRLVNVWATWCAPCVAEFPELVALARRMDMRDFELVTISMDDPKQESRVRAFLEKHRVAPADRLKRELRKEGRTTLNYLYTEASADALVQALDPAWPGPLPHTVLLAPGGEVLWRHTGQVDPTELRAKVIEAMSPFYRQGVE